MAKMELNPSESLSWSKGNDGKWSLTEHEGAGYLSQHQESEPLQVVAAGDLKRPHEAEEEAEATRTKRTRTE